MHAVPIGAPRRFWMPRAGAQITSSRTAPLYGMAARWGLAEAWLHVPMSTKCRCSA